MHSKHRYAGESASVPALSVSEKAAVVARACLLVAVAVMTPSAKGAAFDLPRYRVDVRRLLSSAIGGGESPRLLISIADKKLGTEAELTVANYTRSIEDAFSPEAGRLVLLGELEGRGHIIDVLSIQGNKAALIDTIWSWEISFSPNRRLAAYEFRYPPHGLPAFRNAVLLLYDFLLAPDQVPHVDNDDARKGFILYPNENREKGLYQIASPEAPEGTALQRSFVSPISWNEGSDKIAVIEALPPDVYLVVADISAGPQNPKIMRVELNGNLFLKSPAADETIPPASERPSLLVSSLTFSDNDEVVNITSKEAGPFAAKTVSVSLVTQEETLISEIGAARHLEAPPGTPFVRLSGALEGANLLTRVEPVPRVPLTPDSRVVVSCEVLVGPDGRVSRVLAISGPKDFYKPAEDAVKQWTFKPVILRGGPISVLTTIEVKFRSH